MKIMGHIGEVNTLLSIRKAWEQYLTWFPRARILLFFKFV